MNDKIIAYIRQYHDIYTREAIAANLIKEGYSEADIKRAFEQLRIEVNKSKFAISDQRPSGRKNKMLSGTSISAIAIVVILFLIITGIFATLMRGSTGSRSARTATPGAVATFDLTDAAVAQIGSNRGEISPHEIQKWSYEGQAGEVLTIRVNADIPAQSDQIVNPNGLDPYVSISYYSGGPLVDNGNRSDNPRYTDSLIEGVSLPADGTYLIQVSNDMFQETSGAFTLIIESSLHPTVSGTPTP